MSKAFAFGPALILAGGILLVQNVGRQQPVPLARPLGELALELEGHRGRDLTISEEEQRVAGMSSYVSRAYATDSAPAFWVYVGYYDSQTQGRTIHSPKNCLPGAGWDPLESTEVLIRTKAGSEVPVNRYLLANKNRRALVLYWYQGRGRVSANEYKVKWELLRDAALRGRTDEALVRITVPITTSDADADALARRVAATLVPEVWRLLPN